MTSRTIWVAVFCCIAVPFAGGCEEEPVLGERMLPEAEAVARETLEAAEERPPQRGVPGAKIRIPASVQPAVAVVSVTEERDCGPVTIYFADDSAGLDEAARETLDRTAACFTGAGHAMVIHDEVDPENAESYDDTLARQRAFEVATYLKAQDVDEDLFEVVAVGERGAIATMPRLYPRYRVAK